MEILQEHCNALWQFCSSHMPFEFSLPEASAGPVWCTCLQDLPKDVGGETGCPELVGEAAIR